MNRKKPLKLSQVRRMTQTNDQIPQHFYKYCRIDKNKLGHSSRIFTDSELYFCKTVKFNDPFDCQFKLELKGAPAEIEQHLWAMQKRLEPSLNRSARRRKVREDKKKLGKDKNNGGRRLSVPDDIVKQHTEKWGICCLSEVQDNLLMWAHYADAHQGFCLRFLNDPTDRFRTLAQNDNPIVPFEVTYANDYPTINRIEDDDWTTVEKASLTKSLEWSYEKEWRMVDLSGQGVRRFPSQLLTGVVFGCKMSEKHKEMVRGWCKDRESEVEFYEARQSETAYSLEIVPAK